MVLSQKVLTTQDDGPPPLSSLCVEETVKSEPGMQMSVWHALHAFQGFSHMQFLFDHVEILIFPLLDSFS